MTRPVALASTPLEVDCEQSLYSQNVFFMAGRQLRIDSDVCDLVMRRHSATLIQNIFKDERRRFVASIYKSTADGRNIVMKAFPLPGLLRKLRWRKYGYREFVNHHKAIARGIPTPELFAYFQVTNQFGLTNNCGVFIENLTQHATLRTALAGDPATRKKMLLAAAELLHLCHTQGVNHVDLSVDNVMVGDAGLKVIDWQYATFFDKPRDAQCVMQTAYFLQTASIPSDSHEGSFFTGEVYNRVRPGVRQQAFEAFVTELAGAPRLSVRKRAHLDHRSLKSLAQA